MAWFEWETGRRQPRDSNYGGIDTAMKWEPGGVDAILDGREPTLLPESDPRPDPLQDPTNLRRRRRLQELRGEHGEHEGLLLFIQEIEAEAAEQDKTVTSGRSESHFYPPDG
jgi:hypothetical protein